MHALVNASNTAPSSLLPLWEKVILAKRGSDEGSLSAETDPSSGADCVHATFSHKGRREGRRTVRENYFFVSSIGTTFSGDA